MLSENDDFFVPQIQNKSSLTENNDYQALLNFRETAFPINILH